MQREFDMRALAHLGRRLPTYVILCTAVERAAWREGDWLENDPSQPIRRREADQHVSDSAVPSFCVDICNGAKHGGL